MVLKLKPSFLSATTLQNFINFLGGCVIFPFSALKEFNLVSP